MFPSHKIVTLTVELSFFVPKDAAIDVHDMSVENVSATLMNGNIDDGNSVAVPCAVLVANCTVDSVIAGFRNEGTRRRRTRGSVHSR